METDSRLEWIILNFDSRDNLHNYLLKKLILCAPRVRYALYLRNRSWHSSVAKNLVHRLATGDILVNLDCDNFIGDAVTAIREHFDQGCQLLHLWSGVYGDGTYGRIAVVRELFYALGGYDETFYPMGYQDVDFIHRAAAKGARIAHYTSSSHFAIKNSKKLGLKYLRSTLTWDEMDIRNQARSRSNIGKNILVANKSTPWTPLSVRVFSGRATISSIRGR